MDTGLNFAANELISMLQLEPHPEGGFYSRTYASEEQIAAAGLPARFGADRSISTAIYFFAGGERLLRFPSHQER